MAPALVTCSRDSVAVLFGYVARNAALSALYTDSRWETGSAWRASTVAAHCIQGLMGLCAPQDVHLQMKVQSHVGTGPVEAHERGPVAQLR